MPARVFLLLLFLLPVMAHAQLRPPKASGEYPFIKHEQNVIQQPEYLFQFFKALRALEQGERQKVTVLHLGDSHIQADVFTGQLRQHLQQDTLFGKGGRGLVFPYKLAKTNNPVNYNTAHTGTWTGCRNISRRKTCNWGVSGITAFTTDPAASVTINPSPRQVKYPIQRVQVFCSLADTCFRPVLVADTARSRPLQPVSLDTAVGLAVFELPVSASKITLSLSRTDSAQRSFTLHGLVLENQERGIVYHHAGVNGADAQAWLRSPRLAQEIRQLKPDLVIVSLGTNDAFAPRFQADSFQTAYTKLLAQLKLAAPESSFLLTTAGDCYRKPKYVNTHIPAVAQRIKAAGQTQYMSVWDWFSVMGGLRSVARWQAAGMAARDRIHLSNKGYAYQGDLLYDALMAAYYHWAGLMQKGE